MLIMASMGGMRGEDMRPSRGREEWQRLELDPRQWAYDKWWSVPVVGEDPVPLDPQPAAPRMDVGSPWWMMMVALGTD